MVSLLSLPFEPKRYSLYVSQDKFSDNVHTYVHLEIETKDNKKFESKISEFSDKNVSLPEHLEEAKNVVIDDITKQIEEKKLSSTVYDENVIDISPDSDKPQSKSEKPKACKKKSKNN